MAYQQWVDLTDDEILECAPINGATVESVAIAVAAKLKEKNTPPVVPQGEPVAFKQGNLASFTQDPYPSLGSMFVQLWDGDDVAARVYGDTLAQIQQRIDRLNTTPPSVEAAVLAERERCEKVCDDLYKHDRKSSGYDEGWNDALDIAEQAIRSMK
jgi:hypothetical protein